MLRELCSRWGAARCLAGFRAEPDRVSTARLGIAALPLLLFLAIAWSPEKLLAQNAGADKAADPTAPSTQTAPAAASPQAETQPGAPAVMPPAMASKPKLPTESDYEDVHVTPLVKPADAEKLDANPAAAESEAAPGLRAQVRPFRVDVDLVLVPVTITDPSSRVVTGLEKENFILLDNGEPQVIEHFSSEDAPISLGVIFDSSGSMSRKVEKARAAVVEFLKTANPQDEFFLIAFADKPTLICDFTGSVDAVQGRLMYAVPRGKTALLDAIYLGIAKMRQARWQRKALLILSDGGDNRSRYTENEIKAMVREADVQIYAMGIFDRNPRSREEMYGPQLLSEVTEVTGGRSYTIDNLDDMSRVAEKIGLELRNQYVLGYRPSKPSRDGRWRKVRVKLNPPKGLPQLSVYAKTGYYAPSE